MRSILAVLLILAATPAFAAKKKKEAPEPPPPAAKKEEPAPEPAKEEPKREEAQVGAAATNKPRPYGTGYQSWSVRGGATLGGASAIRATAFGGTHTFGDGYGNGGLEAMYFFGTSPNVDFGLGLRISGWPIALAPGLELRAHLAESRAFHLGFLLIANAPFCFRGMFAGMSFGAHAEAGFMMSYFAKDNLELMFGVTGSATLLMVALSLPVMQGGPNAKLGLQYTLKKHDIGLFAAADISPGWYAPYGRPRASSSLASQRAEAYFIVAVNFMLGVAVKL